MTLEEFKSYKKSLEAAREKVQRAEGQGMSVLNMYKTSLPTDVWASIIDLALYILDFAKNYLQDNHGNIRPPKFWQFITNPDLRRFVGIVTVSVINIIHKILVKK